MLLIFNKRCGKVVFSEFFFLLQTINPLNRIICQTIQKKNIRQSIISCKTHNTCCIGHTIPLHDLEFSHLILKTAMSTPERSGLVNGNFFKKFGNIFNVSYLCNIWLIMLCYKSRHNWRPNKSSTWMDLSYSFELCLSIYTVNYLKLQYCYFASMTSVKSHHSKSDIAPLIKRKIF